MTDAETSADIAEHWAEDETVSMIHRENVAGAEVKGAVLACQEANPALLQ